MALLTGGATRDVLLGVEYLLFGALVVHTLPRNGWVAHHVARPYRRIAWQTLRMVVGVATWPTVFLFELVMNGGHLPLPEDSWIMELLRWPYGDLLRQAGLLTVAVLAWPLALVAEWTLWLVRVGSRSAGGR